MTYLLILAAIAAVGLRAPVQAPRTPVLVELFTSEGCSSCPAADALLEKLMREQAVENAEIVPLSLHVDYWNRLGWRDPYSSKAYSTRQQQYTKIFGDDKLYTPQVVVDGREEVVGSEEAAIKRTITAAASRPHLALKVTARPMPGSVSLAIDLPAAPEGEAIDVLVALTEDDLSSAVTRGENKGRTLTHVAVVRKLQTLGSLERDAFVAEGRITIEPAWKPSKMRAVCWLQGRSSSRVYGTASVSVSAR